MKRAILCLVLVTGIFFTHVFAQNYRDADLAVLYLPDFTLPDPKNLPEDEAVILGESLFINTQQLRGKHVFNALNCSSCHLDAGRLVFAAPIWGALSSQTSKISLERDKHKTLSARIAHCFTVSLNGIAPEEDSEIMQAMIAYIHWLGRNVPRNQGEEDLHGRGFPHLDISPLGYDPLLGQVVYTSKCMLCHGTQGEGVNVGGTVVNTPLWGDLSYTWGAEMARIDVAAAYIKANMPLGRRFILSDQEAWDVAAYINSHERPQDPRNLLTQIPEKTAELFHQGEDSFYLKKSLNDEQILGKHTHYGERPTLPPNP